MPAAGAAKALAFIVFAGALGGAVVGAFDALPGVTIQPRGLAVHAYEHEVNASAGHRVSVPVAVTNVGAETRNVTLVLVSKGPVSASPVTWRLDPGEKRAAWFPVDVAASAAPGSYRLDFVARAGASVGDVFLDRVTLNVVAPEGGIRAGDTVTARFVGILANGSVFDGSLPFSNDPAFPLLGGFTPRAAPFTWTVGESEPLAGASARILGMHAGEAREITVPAADAFGEPILSDGFQRQTVFPLEFKTAPGVLNATRRDVASWLSQTGQDPIVTLRVGSIFTWYLATSGQIIPMKVNVTEIGATDTDQVRWTFPADGEVFTLFSQFPNATRIVARTATEWTLRTEPAVLPGEPFTYVPYWPSASRVTACAPSCDGGYAATQNVTITHLDNTWVGKSFVRSQQGVPTNYTVTSVDDNLIHVQTRNRNPFGGQDITWQIRVLSVSRATDA